MSASSEARLSALDGVLDVQPVGGTLADDLFSVVDTLAAQPSLRRALTDPGMADEARARFVHVVLDAKIAPPAVEVVAQAARLRWTTVGGLANALERQGVRALLHAAQRAGQLDEVEDQLFKVGRIVAADPGLRDALADRRVGVEGRQQLLGDLLAGRVLPVTAQLARRAVVARKRTFDLTLEDYLALAADLRSRAVATITVARPLTAEQTGRLREALGRQVGREVNVRVIVDPSVLGGVRVTLGDEVIEGTVAGRLQGAQRKLA